ncbi:peptidylprolyl isomerase [Aggregatimonas sangjinii]|uniref:Peptidyl-prolyl cis-trans isomerase n=1 Tax=Aggregatimonas sangjinii TaxID=2583587 RepID=A0A5B7SRG8_9FLAO|nr:FKBP-type peptidyl-prolyl cis-trans isomerase [Aggregatimonas sangjinii]QCW99948.1 peptidylprolyl isomerase [Aggregatimonas sangjinii]
MKFAPLFLLFLSLLSCNSKEQTDFLAKNETEIIQYLSDNDLNAQRTSSGLYYIIEDQGNGARPTASSNVTVAYKGYFLDGSVFDESSSAGVSFNLNQVIPGWTEGIPLFQEGGNGMLLVPSHLGYGSSNNRGIPGGSVLLFDIELIAVND